LMMFLAAGAATSLLMLMRARSTTLLVSEQLMKDWSPPQSQVRCASLVSQFIAREDPSDSFEHRKAQYTAQSKDANTFYRATAHIFWKDFVEGGWGDYDLSDLGLATTLTDGSPIQRTSTFTWVTGDQHLSNFGAWKNRNDEVVFGMNDFDEAAIYDFRIDVWRVAISIYNHALTSGLGSAKAEAAVLTFADSYVGAVIGYVGNERAITHEVTSKTAPNVLAAFLRKVEAKASSKKMLDKFTEVVDVLDEDGSTAVALVARDATSGDRRLVKNGKTRLEAVSPQIHNQIVQAFGSRGYGATLQKVGWHVNVWSDEYFKVLDVAQRVGSGVGSFGVGRYYVLLAGDEANGGGVILDVKYEPEPAVAPVLSADDKAWYENLFQHDAMRVVEGQRALSAFVDPFTGWVELNGVPHAVRERSAWKAEMKLASLRSYAEFAEFVTAVATVTATSHVRGSVGKSPGSFKEVIAAALGPAYARMTWGVAVAKVAAQYREQVLLDFECFADFVKTNYTEAA